jgi:hypothetical protein
MYLPGIVIATAIVLPYSQTAPQSEKRGRCGNAKNRRWKRRGV